MAGLPRAVLAFVSLTALLGTNVQADHPYPLVHEVLDEVPTYSEAMNLLPSINEIEDHVRVSTANERVEATDQTLTGSGTYWHADPCQGEPCAPLVASWDLPTSVVADARWITTTPCDGSVEANHLKVGFRTLEEAQVVDLYLRYMPLFSGVLNHSLYFVDGEPVPDPTGETWRAYVDVYYYSHVYPTHGVSRGNWLTWLDPPVTDADVGTVQRTLHIAIDDVDTVTWQDGYGVHTEPNGLQWTASGLVDVVVERLEQPC